MTRGILMGASRRVPEKGQSSLTPPYLNLERLLIECHWVIECRDQGLGQHVLDPSWEKRRCRILSWMNICPIVQNNFAHCQLLQDSRGACKCWLVQFLNRENISCFWEFLSVSLSLISHIKFMPVWSYACHSLKITTNNCLLVCFLIHEQHESSSN